MKPLLSRVWLHLGLVVILIFPTTLLVGCGSKNKKVLSLSGKVTYKDQPVSGGTLTVYPLDDKAKSVSIPLSANGSYQLNSPPLGEVKVTVETESIRGKTGVAYQMPPGMKLPSGKEMKMPEVDTSNLTKYVAIPKKYADVATTTLRCTIKEGPNTVDFVLSD